MYRSGLYRYGTGHKVRMNTMTPNSQKPSALKGFLVHESQDEVHIRVTAGTWTFHRVDIERIDDWDTDFKVYGGRPVEVDIRPGTIADFTQSVQIEVTDRPLTIPDRIAADLNDEQLASLAKSWAARMSLDVAHAFGDLASSSWCQTNGGQDGYACDCLDEEEVLPA